MVSSDGTLDTAPAIAADRWALPDQPPPNLSAEDLRRWTAATAAVRAIAIEHALSKTDVTKRIGVSGGTFWPWYQGTYNGNWGAITERVEKWLASFAESRSITSRLPSAPAFIETATAKRVLGALLFAQTAPSMVSIVLGAGMGKTFSATHYVTQHPHAYLVTMRPTTSSVHGMLLSIADSLGVVERNPARLSSTIGERLKRNGRNTLLILDEAQNLVDGAVNEARFLLDNFGCGLALMGNEELYKRFGGEKPTAAYAQIHRRFGMRVRDLRPKEEDIDALVSAWGLTDPGAIALASKIGHTPGALSQINQTLMLAGNLAAGAGREITAGDVRAAWENRGAGAL